MMTGPEGSDASRENGALRESDGAFEERVVESASERLEREKNRSCSTIRTVGSWTSCRLSSFAMSFPENSKVIHEARWLSRQLKASFRIVHSSLRQ